MISNYNLYSLLRIIDQPRNEARLAWRKRNGKHLRISVNILISWQYPFRDLNLKQGPLSRRFHFIYLFQSPSQMIPVCLRFNVLLLYFIHDKGMKLRLFNLVLIHIDVQCSLQGSAVIPEMAVVGRYSQPLETNYPLIRAQVAFRFPLPGKVVKSRTITCFLN